MFKDFMKSVLAFASIPVGIIGGTYVSLWAINKFAGNDNTNSELKGDEEEA